VEIWYRPERKPKDDHDEQCLLSHGSWQGRFKLSVLPWRALRFTVRDIKGSVVDCDGLTLLRPQRWYHVAASYEPSGAKLWVNGIAESCNCNPRMGPEHRPANPSTAPLLVGACVVGEGIDHLRGTLTDLRYGPKPLSQPDPLGRLPQDPTAAWRSLTRAAGSGVLSAAVGRALGEGPLDFHVVDNPQWVTAERGDQILSLTLTGRAHGPFNNSTPRCSNSSSHRRSTAVNVFDDVFRLSWSDNVIFFSNGVNSCPFQLRSSRLAGRRAIRCVG
jgi:hypothetical protein